MSYCTPKHPIAFWPYPSRRDNASVPIWALAYYQDVLIGSGTVLVQMPGKDKVMEYKQQDFSALFGVLPEPNKTTEL